MAENGNILNRLSEIARSYDDAAWETLANPGLLKRAKKDLENGLVPEIVEAGDAEVVIRVGDNTVRVTGSGFGRAVCTCASRQVCHHVILASFALAKYEPGNAGEHADALSATDEILSLSTEALVAWTQKRNMKKALSILASEKSISIEEGTSITFRLPIAKYEAVYVPGAGLDGVIVRGQRLPAKAVVAACVLSYWKLKGENRTGLEEYAKTAAEKKTVHAIDRGIPERASGLLCDLVAAGVSHCTEIVADRFASFSHPVASAGMPRLGRMISSVADKIRMLVKRDASADETGLALLVARTYALACALRGEAPDIRLTGVARSSYEGMKSILLSGVGAYAWQTASGFCGLTLIFLSRETNEFFTYSDSRPVDRRAGFDPVTAYSSTGIWKSGVSLGKLCSSTFALNDPGISAGGRLSGGSGPYCTDVRESTLDEAVLDELAIREWGEVELRAAENRTLGLDVNDPRLEIVIVKPKSFGKREFDPVSQTFYWTVYDRSGARLGLRVAYETWNKPVFDHLQSMKPAHGDYVVGRIVRDAGVVCVLPYSFIRFSGHGCILTNIGLDWKGEGEKSLISKLLDKVAKPSVSEDYEREYGGTAGWNGGTKTWLMLSELEGELCSVVETGLHSWKREGTALDRITPEILERAGLPVLADYCRKMRRAPGFEPGQILFFLYLVMLHREIGS